MWLENGGFYNAWEAIKNRINNWSEPEVEEFSTTWACTLEAQDEYQGDWDFEPILTPKFDENWNHIWWHDIEEMDPENICISDIEIDEAYE